MSDKQSITPEGTSIDHARALHASGKLAEAETTYRNLLASGDNLDAQHGLALLYNQTGRSAEAIPLLTHLLEQDSNAISSRLVLARCLAATDNLTGAISECGVALEAMPDNPVVLNLAGQLQQQSGNAQGARDYLKRALQADPNHAPALHNLGIALATLGETEAALQAYEGALRFMPAAARVHYNYALALQALGREADAIASLTKALDLRPGMADARLRLLHLKLLHCDWRDLENQTQILEQKLSGLLARDEIGHLSLHVLNLLDLPSSLHRKLAQRMARGISRRAQNMQSPQRHDQTYSDTRNDGDTDSDTDGRVRLGYLSPDLGGHAVGGLLKDIFKHHDAQKFSVRIFSLRNFNDAIADEIRAGAHQFEDLSKQSLDASAERIATFAPDILIDLGGYTQGSRTELLAMRLAPVQMSWLGYLNTMGADFIDYVIADNVVLPSEHEDRYDENVARLPRCFLPFSQLSENALPLTRETAGLPEDAFVFASFNNPCKVQPAEFRAWVRILRTVPESVLWIYDGDRKAVRQNLRAAFELAGLAPSRLVFASMLPMNEHLQRMKLADLFLDTFRYNAGATAIAAAQVGLPILTLAGDTLLARMGASINGTLGLDELVCHSVDQYVAQAVAFARNPDKALELKTRILAARSAPGGLFDSAAFVADLEALLSTLVDSNQLL